MRLEAGDSAREGIAFEPLHSLIALISATTCGLTGNALPRPRPKDQAYGIMRFTFGKSASETSTVPPSLRLVLFAFEVRMWRILVCPRSTLPVAVFLKRLAASLCVFSLGMNIQSIAGMATSASIPDTLPVGEWFRSRLLPSCHPLVKGNECF